jgi:hypothetical protein
LPGKNNKTPFFPPGNEIILSCHEKDSNRKEFIKKIFPGSGLKKDYFKTYKLISEPDRRNNFSTLATRYLPVYVGNF